MPWTDFTIDGASVKATSPADFPGLPETALPATDPKLVEAKRDARVRLIGALRSYAVGYPGGVQAFFDALAAKAATGQPLEDDLKNVLAIAYRIAAFQGGSYGGDLWAEKADQESAALKLAVGALAAQVPFSLAIESSPAATPRTRGRTPTYST